MPNPSAWVKVLAVLAILAILILLALALRRPLYSSAPSGREPNYSSIYWGQSSSGWSARRPSFSSPAQAAAANAISTSNGEYICQRGYHTGVGKPQEGDPCSYLLHKEAYLPVSDLGLENFNPSLLESKEGVEAFFPLEGAAPTATCSDLCDGLTSCIGFAYEREEKKCQSFSALSVGAVPLSHESDKQGIIFLKKAKRLEVRHESAVIFDSFDKELVKWWEPAPRPGRTLLYPSASIYVILPQRPKRVYNGTGKSIVYYWRPLESLPSLPADIVRNPADIPHTWTSIYAYAL